MGAIALIFTSACVRVDRAGARSCPLEASFVQIGSRELDHGIPEWKRDLTLLEGVGIHTVVLQYSGDADGPFDGRPSGREPVRALLAAASQMGMRVHLGLYLDPRWPGAFPVDSELPPPLERPAEMNRLTETCASAPSCVGWYIPEEIDDQTWASAEQTLRARRFLTRTASALAVRAPGRSIAIAPFFTGRLDPDAHARWWRELLADRPVDMVMLQDGAGSGHGSAEAAARMLAALRPVLEPQAIALWSTVELFQQLHGPPRDDLPFAAEPAAFEDVRRRIEAEGATGARLSAFAVLNYMDPSRGEAAAALYRRYAAWCAR